MISTIEKETDRRLDEATVQGFRSSIRGKVITREDASYDDERSVYNGMISRRPALIVKCKDVADVISSLNFAKTQKLILAVRGGGHNAGGLGVCDDGLVIDLSLMDGVRVDLETNT